MWKCVGNIWRSDQPLEKGTKTNAAFGRLYHNTTSSINQPWMFVIQNSEWMSHQTILAFFSFLFAISFHIIRSTYRIAPCFYPLTSKSSFLYLGSSASEWALDRTVPFWTKLSQSNTTTTNVADLGLGTRIIGTIRTLHRHLTLVCIELADDAVICLHGLGDLVPERSVQWRICGPVGLSTVCITSVVLDLVSWTGTGEVWKGVDVCVESVGIVDLKVAFIDFVHSVTRVEIGQWSDGWSNPGVGESITARHIRAVVCIEYFDLCMMLVLHSSARR